MCNFRISVQKNLTVKRYIMDNSKGLASIYMLFHYLGCKLQQRIMLLWRGFLELQAKGWVDFNLILKVYLLTLNVLRVY